MTDENITYDDFLHICKTNGLIYMVVARQRRSPFSKSISLPCRSIDEGRKMIEGLKYDGIGGHFYIKKISFQNDPLLTRIKNEFVLYK